jgi:anti-anti-sigma factor
MVEETWCCNDGRFAGALRVGRKELTFPFLRPFYESATARIESEVRELVIDLSEVVYIDSASLGCLMDICRRMAGRNGAVTLIGMQERVRAIAVMAGLTRHIGVPTEDRIDLRDVDPVTGICAKPIVR